MNAKTIGIFSEKIENPAVLDTIAKQGKFEYVVDDSNYKYFKVLLVTQ